MSVYVIAEVTVTDEAWIPEYAANVHEIVHKHGGRYLSRTANIKTLEGDENDATMIALLEFPAMHSVEAFMEDPAYSGYGAARRAGSRSRLRTLDAVDAAGTIPYLGSGAESS